jgi:hypothetical protein
VNSMRQYPVEMASDDLRFSSIVLGSHSPSILPAQDRDWQSTDDEHPAQHAIRRIDGDTEWQPLVRRIPSRCGVGRTVGRPISGRERAVPADSRVGVRTVAVSRGVEGEGENESRWAGRGRSGGDERGDRGGDDVVGGVGRGPAGRGRGGGRA